MNLLQSLLNHEHHLLHTSSSTCSQKDVTNLKMQIAELPISCLSLWGAILIHGSELVVVQTHIKIDKTLVLKEHALWNAHARLHETHHLHNSGKFSALPKETLLDNKQNFDHVLDYSVQDYRSYLGYLTMYAPVETLTGITPLPIFEC